MAPRGVTPLKTRSSFHASGDAGRAGARHRGFAVRSSSPNSAGTACPFIAAASSAAVPAEPRVTSREPAMFEQAPAITRTAAPAPIAAFDTLRLSLVLVRPAIPTAADGA